MNALVPLVVALPLLVAALLAAVGRHLPRALPDLIGIGTAAAVTGIAMLLLVRSARHPLVYWFGGWHPAHGFAPGIAFVIDPVAAAEAVLAALVVLACLVFSWRYFETVRHLFHTLMLAFLAGMVGFALSGDLFNIFVFFELMSVSGYALCAYRVEQRTVLQGSLNFAILNSVGAFAMLMGIALLYGRTGSLNLVSVGAGLARRHPSGLVVGALLLITVGFLVKAGVAPFHFWLSDAYAVASAPVAAVFTGVMGELAFSVYIRVYGTVFDEAIAVEQAVRLALLVLGVLSAAVGAAMCFMQADLKRQVAFLTVADGGVVLCGIATLEPVGFAGASGYIITAGLLRAALALAIGMLVTRLGSRDELQLRGRGRRHAALAALVALCGLGLAAPVPFASFRALTLIEGAARGEGFGWLPVVIAVCLAVSAGTVLRAAARIFLGFGSDRDPLLTRQPQEPDEGEPAPEERGARRRSWMLVPACALVLVGFGLSFAPGAIEHAIETFQAIGDHAAHARFVLNGLPSATSGVVVPVPTTTDIAYSGGTVLGALLCACAGLWWRKAHLARCVRRTVLAACSAVKSVHDGSVGDYLMWFLAGTGGLAIAWAAALR